MREEELIKGCINEDQACQKALYQKFSGLMYAVCLRYAKHKAEAQDIMQDGFIKVFDNISKFSFNGSFEGWIRRIMVNTALNYYRKSSSHKEQLGIEEHQEEATEPMANSNLGEKELMIIIQQLPEGYKLVFNLYAIEGYSHKEIGEMLEITESTSRSQLSKARKWIQNILEKYNIDANV